MNEIMDTTQLKTDFWRTLAKNEHRKPEFDYDPEMDTCYLYFVPIEPKDSIITHYLDEYVGLLFKGSDNEIVGMTIESFKKSFLPSYENDTWMLSKTGVQLTGIKDFRFSVEAIKKDKPEPHYTLPRFREPIKFESVFT